MALRGHADIQGATDIATLFDLLPGYLPMPSALRDEHKNPRIVPEGRQSPKPQAGGRTRRSVLCHLAAQGVLRRRRRPKRTIGASNTCPRFRATIRLSVADAIQHEGRQRQRLLRDRHEPGRRSGQNDRACSAPALDSVSSGWSTSTPYEDRDRVVLEVRARERPLGSPPTNSAPNVSSCRVRPCSKKKTARWSITPTACCSSTTKPWNRPGGASKSDLYLIHQLGQRLRESRLYANSADPKKRPADSSRSRRGTIRTKTSTNARRANRPRWSRCSPGNQRLRGRARQARLRMRTSRRLRRSQGRWEHGVRLHGSTAASFTDKDTNRARNRKKDDSMTWLAK